MAPYFSARSQIACTGATSPSIEYRLSKAISFGRAGSAAFSSSSRWPMSLCRQICFSQPDWRTPSIIELWLSASDKQQAVRQQPRDG